MLWPQVVPDNLDMRCLCEMPGGPVNLSATRRGARISNIPNLRASARSK